MAIDELDGPTYRAVMQLRGEVELLTSALQFLLLERVIKEPREQWDVFADQFERRIGNRPMPDDMKSSAERKMYIDISTSLESATKAFADVLRGNIQSAAKLADDQSDPASPPSSPDDPPDER